MLLLMDNKLWSMLPTINLLCIDQMVMRIKKGDYLMFVFINFVNRIEKTHELMNIILGKLKAKSNSTFFLDI